MQFNPAVGTVLPLLHGHLSDIWIYWAGPMLGGLVGATVRWIYRVGSCIRGSLNIDEAGSWNGAYDCLEWERHAFV